MACQKHLKQRRQILTHIVLLLTILASHLWHTRRKRKQIFRFKDPMMQPYVIIRGIQSKMIDDAAKTILLQKEQGSLAI